MEPDRIGNYRIDGERGRDATGIVYDARHLVLPRRAVVKVMEAAEPRPIAVQLLREACILEALEHPGIVRVFESGLMPDRRPWFAHERIEGATVADLLAEGPLEAVFAVALLRDIAEVLEHAHRRGIVHCGVRPERIVITGRTRGYPLCIVDWSDARVHDSTSPAPIIEPTYAAPELLDDASNPPRMIDDRVDVYALGVIAYQILTGVLPTRAQHVPTQVRCPDAPPELATLVDQMLASDHWDRPSSAEIHADLVQIAFVLAPPPAPVPSGLRIRQPRWTPAIEFTDHDTEVVDVEVSANDAPEKPS